MNKTKKKSKRKVKKKPVKQNQADRYRFVVEMKTDMGEFLKLAASRGEPNGKHTPWAIRFLVKAAEKELGVTFNQYRGIGNVRSDK